MFKKPWGMADVQNPETTSEWSRAREQSGKSSATDDSSNKHRRGINAAVPVLEYSM